MSIELTNGTIAQKKDPRVSGSFLLAQQNKILGSDVKASENPSKNTGHPPGIELTIYVYHMYIHCKGDEV